MTPAAYGQALVRAYDVATKLARLPLREMLDAIERAEAVAPITEPTLYQSRGKQMREDRETLRALLMAQARLEELHHEAGR